VLERAEQSQFIARVQTSAGQHGFTFSHDLIRRSLRDGINPERKALLHRKLGATAIHNAQAPEVIAEHLEQAGRFHEAAPYRLQAAEKLSRVFDHAEALEQYEKMLAYLPEDASEMHLELLCSVAEVCWKLNDVERAEQCFLEAQRLLGSEHTARLKARIWIGVCQVANQKSDLKRTQESGRQALRYAQESQDETILAAASRWLEPAEKPQL
jgi:tetratricopeptide (TPR) repeat protein